jgi:hypothetical protein
MYVAAVVSGMTAALEDSFCNVVIGRRKISMHPGVTNEGCGNHVLVPGEERRIGTREFHGERLTTTSRG